MTQPFPPPGFAPVPSALSGIELYAPAPEPTTREPDVIDFKCPQCRATTAYCVTDGGLRCVHCGYYEPPTQPVVGKGAEAFEFTVETMTAAAEAARLQAHGWGAARKELQCQNCRARTSLAEGGLTHTCPFCGSNKVLQHDAPQDELRPRFLIPFKIEARACQTVVRDWLGSSWMTPKALQEIARVARFNPIYLPYWTFDANTAADWEAEVGHEETERYYDSSAKEWRTRTVTVWRWESGHARQHFDDLLVPGTSRLSQVLLDRLRSFDTRALVAYEPQFLAGMMAQAYDVPLERAWEIGRERMREQTREACRGQASTSKIRNFSMQLDFSDESWRYVLLPVYVSVYTYEDETYQVMVNGQTGEVSGQRPVDWTKVWLAIAAMVTPGVLLGLVSLPFLLLFLPLGLILIGVAFIALVAGGMFAFSTFQKAREMGHV